MLIQCCNLITTSKEPAVSSIKKSSNYVKIIAVNVFQPKRLKRRNLKKFRLERSAQVSSFQPLRLKHIHCDDLHIILSLSAVQHNSISYPLHRIAEVMGSIPVQA